MSYNCKRNKMKERLIKINYKSEFAKCTNDKNFANTFAFRMHEYKT